MGSSRFTARVRSLSGRAKLTLGLVLGLAAVVAADVGINSGGSVVANKLFVNTYGSARITHGKSDDQSYVVGISNAAITAAGSDAINLHSEVGRGFRITKLCIQPGSATAAAHVQWVLRRATTAPSGGTTITAEVTSGNNFLAKMDPADSNWGGVASTAATEGAAGAILDAGNAFVMITATPPAAGASFFCREYGLIDGKQPVVASGVGNGVTLLWEGTAGGADFGAQIHFVAN